MSRLVRFASAVQGDFHQDMLVSNILIGYRPTGTVADRVFPVVPVPRETGAFAKIDQDNWFRIPDTHRAPRTAAKEVAYTVSSDNYRVTNYELSTLVDWETLDNADPPHQPSEQAGMFLVDQLTLDFEARVVAKVVANVGSTTTLTGNTGWNDFANSDPLKDIDTAINAIQDTTGYAPNQCVIGRKCWQKLKRHPDIVRALFPGAGVGGIATLQGFGQLLGVDEVLVPTTIKNTADEGASNTFSDVWSSYFFLQYRPPNPGILVPTFGYAFRWTGQNIGNRGPSNFAVERMKDEVRKCDIFRTGYYQDEKVVASQLGFLIVTGI